MLQVKVPVDKGLAAAMTVYQLQHYGQRCEEQKGRVYLFEPLCYVLAEAYKVSRDSFGIAQHHAEARKHEEQLHHEVAAFVGNGKYREKGRAVLRLEVLIVPEKCYDAGTYSLHAVNGSEAAVPFVSLFLCHVCSFQ